MVLGFNGALLREKRYLILYITEISDRFYNLINILINRYLVCKNCIGALFFN